MNPQETFSAIRSEIIDLIAKNQHKEITTYTTYKSEGVYLLYVDDFSDDRILPIYIGETDDFQKRHKDHLTVLMAINRLTSERHLNAILRNYHSGEYRYCKLFQYLVNHQLTFKSIHMIILEEILSKDARIQRETELIDRYYAAFLGFNQFPSFTSRQSNFEHAKSAEWMSIATRDMANAATFIDYGYTLFNSLITNGTYRSFTDFSVQHAPSYSLFIDRWNQLNQLREENQKHNNSIQACYARIIDILQPFFVENGLKSEDKKRRIAEELSEGANSFSKEIAGYIKRHAKNTPDFFQWLSVQEDILEDICSLQQSVASNRSATQKISSEIFCTYHSLCCSLGLFPIREYTSFPLLDRYSPISPDIPEDSCLFHIDYSRLRTSCEYDIFPVPLHISVWLRQQDQVTHNTYFLHTCLDDFLENESKYYFIYSNIYSIYSPNPTCIHNIGCDTEITLTTEYKTGINEYTISRFPKYDLHEVFSELNEITGHIANLSIEINGPKQDFIDFQNDPSLKGNLFVKRICQIAKGRKDPLKKK